MLILYRLYNKAKKMLRISVDQSRPRLRTVHGGIYHSLQDIRGSIDIFATRMTMTIVKLDKVLDEKEG